MHVRIRAAHVHTDKEGVVSLEIPVQEVTEADRKTLDKLFPNTYGKVEELMVTEALIASVVKS